MRVRRLFYIFQIYGLWFLLPIIKMEMYILASTEWVLVDILIFNVWLHESIMFTIYL